MRIFRNIKALIVFCFVFNPVVLFAQQEQQLSRHRVFVSTDIGGTDPDDFQSMIHLLMYADGFDIEGLASTSFAGGSTKDILAMIDLYEKDFPKLAKHRSTFPLPDQLRRVCWQGATVGAPFKGFSIQTEGSRRLVEAARKKEDRPLWVLVWGGLEDVAQALHDAPDIKRNIRVYWIGGPNKKWGPNAYAYIAATHPDLWMIETNAAYRGWFMDDGYEGAIRGDKYYAHFIEGRGALGYDFKKYYGGNIKMGDTPSLAFLMNGGSGDPLQESWGGNFVPINRSSRNVFNGNSTLKDTVPTYGILEWRFRGPRISIHPDSTCFTIEISGQQWPGYYVGKGIFAVRYSPKQEESATYIIHSALAALDGQCGAYVSKAPWPGKPQKYDYPLGNQWYSDLPDKALFLQGQQGAATISKFRKAYLMDWAQRWEWLR